MNISESINNLTNSELLKIIGILIAIITTILGFIFKAILEKWKNNFALKLKGIESKNNEREILLSNFSSTSNVSQEKRIETIEQFWFNVVQMKDCISSTGQLIFSILTDKEQKDFFKNKSFSELRTSFINENSDWTIKNEFKQLIEKNELLRPFLGENIWLHYELLQGFLGRTTYIFFKSVDDEKFIFWQDDKYFEEAFLKYLNKSEMELIKSNRYHSYKYALEILEQRLLKEFDNILSGKRSTYNSVSMAKKLSELKTSSY